MKTSVLRIFLAFVVFVIPLSTASAKTDIEFILDVSGSMSKASGGVSQIAAARSALKKALEEVEGDTHVALRAYGHRENQTDKAKSCEDSELVVPFGSQNKSEISLTAANLKPRGYTPIAYSLEKAKGDFSLEREANKVIILLSDGEETCEGDPVKVVQDLIASGFKVTVHSVGFNVDAKTRKQLESIAAAGGGKYFNAKGSAQLATALGEATKTAIFLNKKNEERGEKIKGGDGFDSAVELPLGKELKLETNLKAGQFDFFSIDLEKAGMITLELSTIKNGIREDGSENQYGANACMHLYDPDRGNAAKLELSSNNRNKGLTLDTQRTGRYHLRVGCDNKPIRGDGIIFKVAKAFFGDLGGTDDAGPSPKKSLAIEPGTQEISYSSASDKVDYYSFSGIQDEEYSVGFLPEETSSGEMIDGWYRIYVEDEYRTELLFLKGDKGSGIRPKPFTIPETGKYFIKVERWNGREEGARPYRLVFKRTVAAQPPAVAEQTEEQAETPDTTEDQAENPEKPEITEEQATEAPVASETIPKDSED